MVSSDKAFVHVHVEYVRCEDCCDGGGDTKDEDCGHDLSVFLVGNHAPGMKQGFPGLLAEVL